MSCMSALGPKLTSLVARTCPLSGSKSHRVPAISALRDYAEAGGLISYGSNIVDAYRQAGLYVGRMLGGAKLAELPVVQSDKFELVINVQTARMLGLTVPTSLLSRADVIID